MLHYYLLQFAQKITIGGGNNQVDNVPTLGGDDVLVNVLNAVYFLVGAVAIIVIIVAGIMYVASAGNSSSVTKAKNMILYAAIGVAVSVSAYGITSFIAGRF